MMLQCMSIDYKLHIDISIPLRASESNNSFRKPFKAWDGMISHMK